MCSRGYHVMTGYFGRPDQTAEVIGRAGWPRIGDLATMDDDGQVAAFVRLTPGETAGEEELPAHVREKPRTAQGTPGWRFVTGFPLAGSGKIRKHVLRDQLER